MIESLDILNGTYGPVKEVMEWEDRLWLDGQWNNSNQTDKNFAVDLILWLTMINSIEKKMKMIVR